MRCAVIRCSANVLQHTARRSCRIQPDTRVLPAPPLSLRDLLARCPGVELRNRLAMCVYIKGLPNTA